MKVAGGRSACVRHLIIIIHFAIRGEEFHPSLGFETRAHPPSLTRIHRKWHFFPVDEKHNFGESLFCPSFCFRSSGSLCILMHLLRFSRRFVGKNDWNFKPGGFCLRSTVLIKVNQSITQTFPRVLWREKRNLKGFHSDWVEFKLPRTCSSAVEESSGK